MSLTKIETLIVYVFVWTLQGFFCSHKKRHLGLILPIITSVIFLLTRDSEFYDLLIYQMIIYGITKSIIALVKAIQYKKKGKTNEMRIKDL